VDCPITAEAGTIPEDDDAPNLKDLKSYMMIHHNLHIRQQLYCDRFSEHVLSYAIEWEKVIVSRITTSLAHAEGLRRELAHYQSKVDQIMATKSKTIAKGQTVDEKIAEKLSRNQAKLSNSRKSYETYAADLAELIHEVTARGWKDLHPILLKLAQFDTTLAHDEHQLLSNLTTVSNNLKKIAQRYSLKPESRLADIETLSAKVFVNEDGDRMMITDGHSPSKSSSTEMITATQRNGSGLSEISSKENDEATILEAVSSLLLNKDSRISDVSKIKQIKSRPSTGGSTAKEFSGRPKQMNNQGDFVEKRQVRSASRNRNRETTADESWRGELVDRTSSGRPSSRMKHRGVVDDDKSSAIPFESLNGRDKYSRTSPRSKARSKRDDLTPFDAAVAQDQERNRDRKLPPSSPRQGADSPQNSRYSPRSRSNSNCDSSPKSGQYNNQWSRELVETPSDAKGCSWYKIF